MIKAPDCLEFLSFSHSNLFRISIFEFRIYDFLPQSTGSWSHIH